jgi:hypothetical protein
MFGNSFQEGAMEPSFLYLMMAATYFRQARRTRQPHVRYALRDIGREYLTNSCRVVPAHACPIRSTASHTSPLNRRPRRG